jgi:hypothetical protein
VNINPVNNKATINIIHTSAGHVAGIFVVCAATSSTEVLTSGFSITSPVLAFNSTIGNGFSGTDKLQSVIKSNKTPLPKSNSSPYTFSTDDNIAK